MVILSKVLYLLPLTHISQFLNTHFVFDRVNW
jgi:hypothetical protein